MKKFTFVLAGDNQYSSYIETTLKSILYHHRDCRIYVLNDDILPEWFKKVNQLAYPLNSEVIDIKLVDEFMDWDSGVEHINRMGYARYFIPKYLEEDKVLYLDSDIIVTKNLDDLFLYDLEEHYMAAVFDDHSLQYFGDYFEYNSGFLLINNKLWKNDNLHQALSEKTVQVLEEVHQNNWHRPFNGDQTIINLVCRDRAITLPSEFNYQVGMERFAIAEEWANFNILEEPKVVHFVTDSKPWSSMKQFRFKELWWEYHSLDYSDIIANHFRTLPEKNQVQNTECFILTNSQDIEHIEYLAKSLPDITFKIAAYSSFGSHALKLQAYQNIKLYPLCFDSEIVQLLKKCDFYLNINHGGQVGNILKRAKNENKLVLSFDNIDGFDLADYVFENVYPDKLVHFLLDLKK